MANEILYKSIKKVSVVDTTGTIPAGFQSASLLNKGSVDATFTQDGETFTILAGSVFEFNQLSSNMVWKAVSINAAGTEVEVAYYL